MTCGQAGVCLSRCRFSKAACGVSGTRVFCYGMPSSCGTRPCSPKTPVHHSPSPACGTDKRLSWSEGGTAHRCVRRSFCLRGKVENPSVWARKSQVGNSLVTKLVVNKTLEVLVEEELYSSQTDLLTAPQAGSCPSRGHGSTRSYVVGESHVCYYRNFVYGYGWPLVGASARM